MRYLLFIRFITIAFAYMILRRYLPDVAAPLSIFSDIIHEIGHAVACNLTGGEVLGFTLTSESTEFYACTRGGGVWFTLILGNLMSFGAAWFFVFLGTKGERYFRQILIGLGGLMLLTAQRIGDDNLLPMPMVWIYVLLFAFFYLIRTNWVGAFLVFFGMMNLAHVAIDALQPTILSDTNRFQHLTPMLPMKLWTAIWLGATAFISYKLLEIVAATQVEWARGKKIFGNFDAEKLWLFISILPPMLGFAVEELFEFFGVQFLRVFDGIKRFLSV